MTVLLVLALAAGQAEADPAKIAAAGLRSAKKFQDSPASWTVTHQTPTGAKFVVDVVKSGDRRRLILTGEAGGQKTELARILECDGFWYVTEGTSAGKYRPYEAPLSLSTAYLYLTRSDALVISDAAAMEGWKFEAAALGVATFRSPLSDATRAVMERMLAQLEAAGAPGLAKSKADLRDTLDHGLALKVDVQSGVVVELSNAQRRQSLSNLKWLDPAGDTELAVPERRWMDLTGDPTAGDRGELVMMGHNGMWRPGLPKGEFDARLLDLKSGAIRRVPYRGAQAIPGCFLKDRLKIVVTGLADDSGLLLFEIDLKTGANRPLGGKLLETGINFFPALSPDGRRLAALHRSGAGKVLESQVAIIDLETGQARFVGKPLDTAFLSWHPDGKQLVLIQRECPDPSKPAIATVSRMDLEGRLTPILKGDQPAVLPSGDRILFHDPDGAWKTCDLQGKDVRPMGDGLRGMGFPAPAPDGKRILFMRFRAGLGPEPVIVTMGGADVEPATELPGMWGMPAWR